MLGLVLTAYKKSEKQWLHHATSTFLSHINRCRGRPARNDTTVPLGNRDPVFFFLSVPLNQYFMLKATSCSKMAARVPAIQSAFQASERGKRLN